MDESRLITIGQIGKFLSGSIQVGFSAQSGDGGRHAQISWVLKRFDSPPTQQTRARRTAGLSAPYQRLRVCPDDPPGGVLERQLCRADAPCQRRRAPGAPLARTCTGLDVGLLMSAEFNEVFSAARFKGDMATGVTMGMTGLAYNKKLFAKRGWSAPMLPRGLADPQFKGKVVSQSLSSWAFGLHGFHMLNRINGGSEKPSNPDSTQGRPAWAPMSSNPDPIQSPGTGGGRRCQTQAEKLWQPHEDGRRRRPGRNPRKLSCLECPPEQDDRALTDM